VTLPTASALPYALLRPDHTLAGHTADSNLETGAVPRGRATCEFMLEIKVQHTLWTRFCVSAILVTILAFVAAMSGFNAAVTKAGERLTTKDLIAYQSARPHALYRTALADKTMSPIQRMERFELLQPEVIALGSSRVLQFRQSHFSVPFANMGMSLHLAHYPDVAREIVLKKGRLNTVILAADFWLFHPLAKDSLVNPLQAKKKTFLKSIIKEYLNAPSNFILYHSNSWSTLIRVFCACIPSAGRYLGDVLGLGAFADGAGVSRDGSYHYTWTFDENFRTQGFKDIAERIQKGDRGFEPSDYVSARRLNYFRETVAIFERAGISVITIIPPVAPEIAELMDHSGKYGIIADLSHIIASMPKPGFNFHYAKLFGSSDCEFVDGIHGGEVAYLRMLKAIGRARTDFARILDPGNTGLIERFEGHVNAYQHPWTGDTSRTEQDFLQLGCTKRSPQANAL
jgi:hypothetical protein